MRFYLNHEVLIGLICISWYMFGNDINLHIFTCRIHPRKWGKESFEYDMTVYHSFSVDPFFTLAWCTAPSPNEELISEIIDS